MTAKTMEELVALCKRRGFIFQSNEIYGGLQGLYDYGPLGIELKNNLKQEWWRSVVYERDDIEGLAIQLRNRLSNEVEKILSDKNNIGIFIVGSLNCAFIEPSIN